MPPPGSEERTARFMTEVLANPETSVDILRRRAGEDPERVLVSYQDGRIVTVGALNDSAWAIAQRLCSVVGPGERVATVLHTGPTQLGVCFALTHLRAVEVPISVSFPPPAIQRALGHADAGVVLVDARALRECPEAVEMASQAALLIVMDDPGVARDASRRHLLDLPVSGRVGARGSPLPEDPGTVMFTSGTTGRPKAAVLPMFAGVRQARRVAATMGYGPEDVIYSAFPWHHIMVRHAGLLPALITGARLVVRERFSASTFWQTCRDEGVTAFQFLGATAAILLAQPESTGDQVHAVRVGYGAPAPEYLWRAFKDRFGVNLLESYATTEVADVAANTLQHSRVGTAGRVVPEYQVVIRDAEGVAVPPGETGNIMVRPRHPWMVTLGYLGEHEPPATSDCGWFVTGDRGSLDGDGYLTYRGRRSDVVRRRGETISAWEVEEALRQLPGVGDCAALGVPSALTEEDLLVVVERTHHGGGYPGSATRPGVAVDGPAIHRWCREHLSAQHAPRYVRFVDTLPRNEAARVAKHELRSAGVADAWDAEAARRGPLPDEMTKQASSVVGDREP
jgi:crotonobetaine/carnitine-CoA ligase